MYREDVDRCFPSRESSMTNFIEEFQSAMSAAGFEPKGGKITADDKWHQAACDGDKGGKFSGAYSMKIVSADFAIGTFFSRKDPDKKHKWHSKSDQKLTPEERKKIKKEIEAQQRRKEIDEEKRQLRISKRLTKVFENLPKATDDHPYLVKKGVKAHGIRYRKKGNELIIPIRGADTKIWTVQRILADGSKFLFTGGRKKGSYFPLASSKEALDRIILCEGFATGASIREATSLPVFAAIDSGNLKPVIAALKQKYPLARFIIAADNDAFTLNAKKEPWNVGITKAHEAAEAVGGAFVVAPDFSGLDPAEYERNRWTDFNDLQAASSGEVAKQIKEFLDKIPSTPQSVQTGEAAASDEGDKPLDQHAGGGDFSEEGWERDYDYAGAAENVDITKGDFGMNFKVLGYNEGNYYYFPFKERQIVALSAGGHTMQNLFRLDDLDNWMNQFGASETSEKKMVMYASNALIQLAKHRGVFEEKDHVRGSGAWLDDGKKILHCGDAVYIDGVKTPFESISSDYTYIASSKVTRPSDDPLSSPEAYALRQICEAVTWENKLSGSLLAGFLVIAPVCGALSFRPHVWISGEHESGKSTVMDKIIKPVIGSIAVSLDGRSTEPKIRQVIGYGARPVIFDEAEKSGSIEAVIELARASTDGKHVGKFGQKIFKALSCFCFSAINPPVNKASDESRISFMMIKKNRRSTAIEEYNALLAMIEKTITKDYSARLLARTMKNLDALFDNIKTFERAARPVVKSARAAQMIGAFLGGLYLLSKTDRITPEAAEEWIKRYDWTTHTMVERETEPMRLLQYISSSLLKIGQKETSIGDLIYMAHDNNEDADKILRYNGIAVKDGRIFFATDAQALAKHLKDTDWSNKPTMMLSNLDGAEKFKIMYFSRGVKTSGVSIPIKYFIEKEEAAPTLQLEMPDYMQEIPF